MSAIQRGLRNPFRNKVRTTVVLLLLSIVIGLFAVMVQATFPQMDATKQNAYAMVIALRPGAPMRAIGEVDCEAPKS